MVLQEMVGNGMLEERVCEKKSCKEERVLEDKVSEKRRCKEERVFRG